MASTSPDGQAETDRFIPSAASSGNSTESSPARSRRLLQMSLILNAILLLLYVANFFEETKILEDETIPSRPALGPGNRLPTNDNVHEPVLHPPSNVTEEQRTDPPALAPTPAPPKKPKRTDPPALAPTPAPPKKPKSTPSPTMGERHKLHNANDVRALQSEIKHVRDSIENEFPGILASQEKLEEKNREAIFVDGEEIKLIEKLVRIILDAEPLTISFGGMSDVAGHGNFFEDSYPIVFHEMMKPVFTAAGLENFVVRNQAMGGIPSYPHSLCMGTMLGDDADIVVWDFRMVERDPFLSELFLRQALMLPRQPAVMFKRSSTIRGFIKEYRGFGTHVIDETDLIKNLEQDFPDTAEKLDKSIHCDIEKAKTRAVQHPQLFTEDYTFDECPCPGQVKWHSGFMIQRVRAAQLALVYLRFMEDASKQVIDILKGKKDRPADPPQYVLPEVVEKGEECKEFCYDRFDCASSWTPHTGFSLEDVIVDEGHHVEGNTRWELRYPSSKEEREVAKGHSKCNYKDGKLGYYGDGNSGWIFFELQFEADKLHNADDKRMVGFCGDVKKDWFEDGSVLVLINQEDVAVYLDEWLTVGTLGVRTVCFATDRAVNEIGENEIGFRVMEFDIQMSITHIFWT